MTALRARLGGGSGRAARAAFGAGAGVFGVCGISESTDALCAAGDGAADGAFHPPAIGFEGMANALLICALTLREALRSRRAGEVVLRTLSGSWPCARCIRRRWWRSTGESP
jgi:hypothetical protein